MDPERLPDELVPLAPAIDVVSCMPRPDGWRVPQYPGAPRWPLVPGAPPFDGVYRASWLSTAVCVRLDVASALVPARLAEALAARYPEHLGSDGAFYVFGVAPRSQRANRDDALLDLALRVVDAAAASV